MLPIAFMYTIYSFFKLIAALSEQSSWKHRATLCTCVVADVMNTEQNYKRRKGVTRNQYSMHVNYQGNWIMGMYEEILHPNHTTDLFPGKNVSYLYDPIHGLCKDPAELKADVKNYFVMLLTSIAIIAGCLVLVSVIG